MPPYGDGTLLQRRGVFYLQHYHNGRRVVESLRTTDRAVAERRKAALRRQRERGTYQDPTTRRITVDELLDDLETHLEVRKAAGLKKAVREELGHIAARELRAPRPHRHRAVWR